jgi:hypothetical protein
MTLGRRRGKLRRAGEQSFAQASRSANGAADARA